MRRPTVKQLAERIAVLESDRMLHPSGRCGCFGEGRCQWCQMIAAQEEAERLAERVKLLEAKLAGFDSRHRVAPNDFDEWVNTTLGASTYVGRFRSFFDVNAIHTFDDLMKWTEEELLQQRNFGRTSLLQLRNALEKVGRELTVRRKAVSP